MPRNRPNSKPSIRLGRERSKEVPSDRHDVDLVLSGNVQPIAHEVYRVEVRTSNGPSHTASTLSAGERDIDARDDEGNGKC